MTDNLSKQLTGNQELYPQEMMLNSIQQDLPIGIFWKDRDRRFIGANQFFRDYYDFKDDSDFIGKTDEEMGWHVDPDPFMNDEYHVIKDGVKIVNAAGTCISHGQIRNIIASKAPLYQDGKIIGLIGCFVDVTENDSIIDEKLAIGDEFTNLLSTQGFESTYHYYVRAYMQRHSNFGIWKMSFEQIHHTTESAEIIRDIAKLLCDLCGLDSSLAYTDKNTFLIMSQISSEMDLKELQQKLRQALDAVDGLEKLGMTMESWSYRDASHNDPESLLNQIMN